MEVGVRPRLDRERILDAAEPSRTARARRSSRCAGSAASCRRDPTAIYRHFRNKQEMLVGLADRMFGTAAAGPEPRLARSLKIELRYGLKRYRSHPELAMLLAIQPDNTPNLEGIADRGSASCSRAGPPLQQATAFFQIIENHVVGTGLYYSLVEQRRRPPPRGPGGDAQGLRAAARRRFPHAVAVGAAPLPRPRRELRLRHRDHPRRHRSHGGDHHPGGET